MANGQLHLTPPMPTGGYSDLREWVRSWLHRHPVADLEPDEVALATVELVSNSMRHGTGIVDVNLTGDGTVLLLEVGDTSRLRPRPRAADDKDVGGRGLALVTGLSRSWGVVARPDGGKTVWCEFSSLPAARPRSTR
jgi:anti-sigma regulatory factor (Ser/Thr protein kinase)